MDAVAIGMIGSFFILSAWLYEAFRTIKRGDHLDAKFTGFYIIGLSILTYYSLLIDSMPFVVLNGIILVITIVELDMALRHKKKKRSVNAQIKTEGSRRRR